MKEIVTVLCFWAVVYTCAQTPQMGLPDFSVAFYGAKYSVDGKTILANGIEGAHLIETVTGNLLYTFPPTYESVSHAFYVPYGNRIVTKTGDSVLRVWDIRSKKMVSEIKMQTNPSNSVEMKLSPDAVKLAFYDADAKGMYVYDLYKGALNCFIATPEQIKSIDFSADSKSLLAVTPQKFLSWTLPTGASDNFLHPTERKVEPELRNPKLARNGTWIIDALAVNKTKEPEKYLVRITDSNTGSLKMSLTGEIKLKVVDGIGFSFALSSNEKLLFTCSATDAVVWDMATGKKLYTIETAGYITHACFSPDNKSLLVNTIDMEDLNGSMYVWDVASGKMKMEIKDRVPVVLGMDECYSNYTIATGNAMGACRVWNLRTGVNEVTLKEDNQLVTKVFAAPLKHELVTVSFDGLIRKWDVEQKQILKKSNPLSNRPPTPADTLLAIKEIDEKWKSVVRLLQNNEEMIRSVSFSKDFSKLAVMGRTVTNLIDYKTMLIQHKLSPSFEFAKNASSADMEFSTDGKEVAACNRNNSVWFWHTKDGMFKDSLPDCSGATSITYSPDGKRMATTSTVDKSIKIWDVQTRKLEHVLTGHSGHPYKPTFSPDGKTILSSSSEKATIVWSTTNGKRIQTIEGLQGFFRFAANGKLLLCLKNDRVEIIDASTYNTIASFIPVNEQDYVCVLPSGYYRTSPNAAKSLFYIQNDKTVGFDQLDAKYNRPDKVLQALGKITGEYDTVLINSYYKAWQKRIKKMGIDTMLFTNSITIPVCDFINRDKVAYNQTTNSVTLQISAHDSSSLLGRFNLWVNEVPVFGKRGVDLRNRKVLKFDTTLTVTLNNGENRIEASVTDANGVESYKVPLMVNYTNAKPKPAQVYFIGIGVNNFTQLQYNLKYSVKDVNDLADAIKQKYGKAANITTLTNEKVTVENVTALKEVLMKTSVDDKVIISFSGHGLFSKEYDYYLSTHNTDFVHPEKNGLAYEVLEALLDDIPARHKLLLIDACHSGEIDKDEKIYIKAVEESITASANGLSKGAAIQNIQPPVIGFKSSLELMKEVFSDVSKGSGTFVISAAGGNEYAYEQNNLRNGVFTFSILEWMKAQKTSTVLDMKNYVSQRVEELTGGLQKPTSRAELTNVNWTIW
ncbi:MAG: caspase family protein [Chitinophagales bacterium]|nr:caspase family protein [Chitinophagales bacterium]